ncbi:MAG: hypothetical protein H3C68_01800 [Deltaproteobacteria bacterium]|nr:hypothetical protein [Deltaproteobacteria bacterium]MBZ0219012.1 hypothetical protein [Deltaproteobacteria bacterium]
MKRRRVDKAGYATVRALFWITLLSSFAYGVYKLAPPYIGYMMLKSDVGEEAKFAHMHTDEALAEHILAKAAAWDLPLDETGLVIERGRENIYIYAEYTVVVNFLNRYEKEFFYNIEVQRPLKQPGEPLH